jgi:hypothetical protein
MEVFGSTLQAIPFNGSLFEEISNFDPIPTLQRQDADVFIFFLSANAVLFSAPTIDNWYNATKPVAILKKSGEWTGRLTLYAQDEAASPLACLQQDQFCNPNLPEGDRCSPLSGSVDAPFNALNLFQDQEQLNRFMWTYNNTLNGFPVVLIDPVLTLGIQTLTSRYDLTVSIQGPLPDNQWQLDVQHWHSTNLATLQASFVGAATGPSDPNLNEWLQRPTNAEEKTLCQNQVRCPGTFLKSHLVLIQFQQKILSTAYTSFSLFGLCFTFVVGGLIIIISYILDPVLSCLRKRRGHQTYAQLEWCTNEILQVQRLAHEELGLGTWSHATSSVPITKLGELLGLLDLADPDHPKLRTPLVKENDSEPKNDVEEMNGNVQEKDTEPTLTNEQGNDAHQTQESAQKTAESTSTDCSPASKPEAVSLTEKANGAQPQHHRDDDDATHSIHIEVTSPLEIESSRNPHAESGSGAH